ncbi:Malate dehydrogenase (EC [Olavius sp. associated proteobacterium Delta 1]|nr:Malate dehydrogenase (EC [Olavius sp. associated proteobacterium Delta 1]
MKVAADHLMEITTKLLQAIGAGNKEARLVAKILVQADLRGIRTHGCAFLPLIAERCAHGLLDIPTKTTMIADEGAIIHIDGNNGLGQVAAVEAMQHSIHKARKHGVALALIRNTNHIGFLGYYTRMAAADGMIGICATNAAASVAPWGGAEPFFGSNPLSIAAPVANAAPIVLDMSASVVARGKIRRAQRLNENIPEGWALDETGGSTTDPAEALKGSLLPIAGHKGSGLALFIDLMCGLLAGSKYGRDLLTFHKPIGPTGVGAMFMAVDIGRFMPLTRFETLVKEYAAAIRNSQKAVGIERIFLPGEIETDKADASKSRGIEVDSQIVEKINLLLEKKDLAIRIEEN